MRNKSLLMSLIVLLLSVSIYLMFTAYQAKNRSGILMKEFELVNDSLEKSQTHTRVTDSTGALKVQSTN